MKNTAIVFLLAFCAATFSASHAARVPAFADADPKNMTLPGLVIVPQIFGGGEADPELLECLESVLEAGGCVVGLLESLMSGKISLKRECCLAVGGMSEHCFSSIFAEPIFGSVFPGLVKAFCDAMVPASSPPAA